MLTTCTLRPLPEPRRYEGIQCVRRLEAAIEGDDHGFTRAKGPGDDHDGPGGDAQDAGEHVIGHLLEAELEVGFPAEHDQVVTVGLATDLSEGIPHVFDRLECHALLGASCCGRLEHLVALSASGRRGRF